MDAEEVRIVFDIDVFGARFEKMRGAVRGSFWRGLTMPAGLVKAVMI